MAKCSQKHVSRQVIANQLLAALDDKGKVAIVASAEDLELLISVLRYYPVRTAQVKRMQTDLQMLRDAAFPKDPSS